MANEYLAYTRREKPCIHVVSELFKRKKNMTMNYSIILVVALWTICINAAPTSDALAKEACDR